MGLNWMGNVHVLKPEMLCREACERHISFLGPHWTWAQGEEAEAKHWAPQET